MRFINPLGNIAYERVVYDGDSSDGKGLVGISSLSWRCASGIDVPARANGGNGGCV